MSLQFLLVITLCLLVPMVLCQDCSADILIMDNTAMPQVFLSPSLWYSALTAHTESSKRPKLLYSYNHALHGFSTVLTDSELKSVRSSKGFLLSIKDSPVTLYTTRSAHFLGLDYGYGAWPASNYGEGIIIGIVDTGIWPESPSFRDEGMPQIPSRWKGACENGTNFNSSMCNKKLIGARYFSKGVYAGDPNVTITNSTRDNKGHGTHISSIAAGNYVDGASWFGYASGTARGMAPRAALAMYKPLFDNYTSCSSDVLAALDQAIADGVDILSLSIGPQLPSFEHDPLSIATFTAMEKGIFVSMAAGNEGSDIKTLGNDIPWATIVGSGTVDREFRGTLLLGNGVSIQGYSLHPGKAIHHQVPVLFLEQCDSALLENQSMIIVCQKSFLSNYHGISALEAGGAVVGKVYITNDMTDMDAGKFPTAALLVAPENGQILLEYINKTTHPTASMYFQETSVGTKPAPMVAEYSSRGPSARFPSILKPDVIAPGDNILGSWIPFTTEKGHTTPKNTGFYIDSGTSMASPHVAGVAALLKKAHPDWSPAAIRSAIMTTADILDNTLRPIKEIIGKNSQAASPLAIGAGHINPNRALDPGLIYDLGREDYINLLCAMNYTTNQIKALVRSGSFNCSRPSLDLNYPSFIAYFASNSTANSSSTTTHVFDRKVKNVGEKSSRYFAKLTPIDGFNLTVQPEYLEFKDQAQELTFKLTIQGPKAMKDSVLTGYLTWDNMNGKQAVRSPIVVTTYN